MTTVTVEYDETNPLADKVLDLLRSLGAKIKVSPAETELDAALNELRSGKPSSAVLLRTISPKSMPDAEH